MSVSPNTKKSGSLQFPRMMAGLLVSACLITAPSSSQAQEVGGDGYFVTATESVFEDAVTDVTNAIVNQGLVIDYTGKVGDMLARTGEAVGMETPYKNAVYMQFCSAKHTHAVVAADPLNIAVCPYVVFVYELADGSGAKIGYRRPVGVPGPASADALAGIDGLLKGIVLEAAEGM